MGFLPLGFAAPAVLGALALLPVIWWLLRLTPPRPRRVAFPPTRLLADLARREETPAHSPWWLVLLRLALAAALIVALAGPMWRPTPGLGAGSGPLLLLVDNGWAAGPDWEAREKAAEEAIDGAERDGRAVSLVATAEGTRQDFAPTTAAAARERLAALAPRPWQTDRAAIAAALPAAFTETPPGLTVFISDRLAAKDDGFTAALEALGSGPVTILEDHRKDPLAIAGLDNTADALSVRLARLPPAAGNGLPGPFAVRAVDEKGFEIGTVQASFEGTAAGAVARFDLPTELRNDIARFEIAGERSAGAVHLVDDRWRRRTVGLISGGNADLAQPLLSPLHYLSQALAPYADLREPRETEVDASVERLIGDGVSVIALADIGRLPGPAHDALSAWVDKGGVLVRFAGPRLAAGNDDDLVPVRLRQGGRVLGGTLSWENPQPLAAFSPASPFAGLQVPDDVTVTRQVLAEPDADLGEHTWASLADGTPLVTARKRGEGWIVLFHVTADTAWSNLPLSGTFVEMLRRIVAFSAAGSGSGEVASGQPLPPVSVLDGLGRLVPPGPDVQPIAPGTDLDKAPIGPTHPPGLYGAEQAYRVLNLFSGAVTLTPFDPGALGGRAHRADLATEGPVDLKPWLLGAVMILFLADSLVVLLLGRGLGWRRPAAAASLIAAALLAAPLLVAPSGPARAAEPTASASAPAPASDPAAVRFAEEATTATRIGYVTTGNATIDEESRLGLEGLTRFLGERTALEAGAPMPIDIERDELAFFPVIYWPIDPDQPKPSEKAMARIDAYMRNGGTILFDTRDQLSNTGGSVGPATAKLREILDGLDIPPLEPVPPDHVLTKAFYLLQDFPGRWDGSPLWVEASEPAEGDGEGGTATRPVRSGDGVSPIIITANDFAGAWAVSDTGDWLYPTVPADSGQREHAIRSGINIVMYALTGNYKADQVHVPALLERLGQ
ncbi:N-terminal double-transmembrane domain-containing protein [Pseudoxanthobacter soli DSM 19599]|uniref:N-terminal double-transmembrane domain-containing protein n=1 Tax=Pseudoxanthobacter soli DSM 19599 TaxID=1123029 RepID=A0A1M7ZBZ8_9HYPH|nr:DUF4159 domain-containing protein [Pseudoxanthobacter soli]SHO62414.1 N-terminal double-transmembrane domain-containing protein [Pseudoxanthobacter soli DSM 19599]